MTKIRPLKIVQGTSESQKGNQMTTETKHTPGPWKIRRIAHKRDDLPMVNTGYVSTTIVDAGGESVADIRGIDSGINNATAHLIAAAPELLAACEAYIDARRRGGNGSFAKAEALALAAIERATA